MVIPAATLMYLITLSWQKVQKSKLRYAVEKGFAPLTVGLILATSLVMSKAADHDWRAYLITGVATLIFVRTTNNPLIVVGAAALWATSASSDPPHVPTRDRLGPQPHRRGTSTRGQ